MRLVFCGTPSFAVPTLQALHDASHDIALVVTQPDRPSGRGLQVAPPPVKQLAASLGVPIAQPEKIKTNAEFRAQLERIAPEAIVVVGYGRIIPQWMIDLPRHGNINLHGSLLPKYRGAAPVQWAIAMGETVSGVTTMRIDAGLDTGDMLLQIEEPITPEDTAETLGPRLAQIGAPLMVATLKGLAEGTITPQKQDDAGATLAPILKKEDGQIDFARTATEIWNRLRGFQPWPGAYARFRGKTLNLCQAKPVTDVANIPAAHFGTAKDRLFLGCGQNTVLEVLQVQPEGKRHISARDFIHGYRPRADEELGS